MLAWASPHLTSLSSLTSHLSFARCFELFLVPLPPSPVMLFFSHIQASAVVVPSAGNTVSLTLSLICLTPNCPQVCFSLTFSGKPRPDPSPRGVWTTHLCTSVVLELLLFCEHRGDVAIAGLSLPLGFVLDATETRSFVCFIASLTPCIVHSRHSEHIGWTK